MIPSMTFGRTQRGVGSTAVRLVCCLAVLALVPGCTSSVDVSFQLVAPCSDRGLLSTDLCAHISVIIWSLDPSNYNLCVDPSNPQCEGPLARNCEFGDRHCKISGPELEGPGLMVDVLCRPTMDVAPVARATSGALLFDDSSAGVAGMKVNLLLGKINYFVETTVIDSRSSGFPDCSRMAESSGRFGHASVLLDDGTVLITGGIRRFGQGVEEILGTAEIFDPSTGTHELLLDSNGQAMQMKATSRAFHTATRLRDKKILIAGGIGLVNNEKKAIQSAELFDPETRTFSSPSNMGFPRAHHTATLLSTGQVLVVGGATYDNGRINDYWDSAAIYDPNSESWVAAPNTMSVKRAFHQAVMLDTETTEGKVVIFGGENLGGTLNSLDILDPGSMQFYRDPPVDETMARNRSHFCAVLLEDGRVLVAGGTTVADDPATPDTIEYNPDTGIEIYDPFVGVPYGSFTEVDSLGASRMDHTCSLLQDGNVMIAGGLTGGGEATEACELVRDDGGGFSVEYLPGTLVPARYLHRAVTLRSGWVLLTGGLSSQLPDAPALVQSILFVPPSMFQ